LRHSRPRRHQPAEAEFEAQSFFVASTVSDIEEAHAGMRQRTQGTGNHLDRGRLWGVASDSHNPPIDLTRVRLSASRLQSFKASRSQGLKASGLIGR
jgi:hypothetical protein